MSDFTPGQLALDPILGHFGYDHLPRPVREIAAAYTTLAVLLVTALPRNAERTVSLRKLLEARDAGIRSAIELERPARHLNAADPQFNEPRNIGVDHSEEPLPFGG